MISAIDVAYWFINKGIDSGQYQTNLTLNKLAYFAHGFSYRIMRIALIDINLSPAFEAWDYGPVSVDIYHGFKHYGATNIVTRFSCQIKMDKERDYLNNFWESFGCSHTPSQLVGISHRDGGAWARTKKENRASIPEQYIKDEFTRRA